METTCLSLTDLSPQAQAPIQSNATNSATAVVKIEEPVQAEVQIQSPDPRQNGAIGMTGPIPAITANESLGLGTEVTLATLPEGQALRLHLLYSRPVFIVDCYYD